MALDDDIRILAGVRLFEGFTADQLRLLAFGAEQIRLAAGRTLYVEEDEADSAFVVVNGRIALFRDNDGDRILVGTAERGAILGEMALIADTRRMTGAVAAVDSDLLRLNRRVFRRILEEYPEAAQMLLARISREFHTLVRRIEELAPRFEG